MIEEEGEHAEGCEDAYAENFDPIELDIQNRDNGEQVVCIL